MRLPTIQGVIRRRILVNYRLDPRVVQPMLPSRFRPKLYEGRSIAGICLIRLEHMRPKALPEIIGVSSENAAHRIAVVWDGDSGEPREGVFIPRRDTDSALNHLLGGRVFPGEYNSAIFKVAESDGRIEFSMKSEDETVLVDLAAEQADSLPDSSIFGSLAAASSFFEAGSLGYSARSDSDHLDGMRLATSEWRVEPLAIERVYSSFFADEARFPRSCVEFDHALIMRNIAHEWHAVS